jgi:hypothetical protein
METIDQIYIIELVGVRGKIISDNWIITQEDG